MNQSQYMLVPAISSYPGNQGKAFAVLRWLVKHEMVEPTLSVCGLNGSQGYAMGKGAMKAFKGTIAEKDLPWDKPNGLVLITDRCVFAPNGGAKARCPECRKAVSIALWEHVEEWVARETDNFMCPHCAFEDDINGFVFTPACAFSDLGFIFTNWPGEHFNDFFIQEIKSRLGFGLCRVQATYQALEG